MRIMSRKARPCDITLYNLVSTAGQVATYQRTYLKFVSLDTGYSKRMLDKGVTVSDTVSLVIDLRDYISTSNRKFIGYKEWLSLANKTGYFTFGSIQDFFVKGNVSDTLPNETKQTMSAKHQVFSITKVDFSPTDENKNTIITVLGK